MELLWIVFIALCALGMAYCIGGFIDRRGMYRQQNLERQQRLKEMEDLADFSLGFASLLAEGGYITRYIVPATAKALGRYTVDFLDEERDDREWAHFLEALENPKEP